MLHKPACLVRCAVQVTSKCARSDVVFLSWVAAYTSSAGICAGLHSADGLMQEVFSALWQGTLAKCNALANHVRVALTHGHSD